MLEISKTLQQLISIAVKWELTCRDVYVIPNSYVKQGDDSTNTDKDQSSDIGVSFGDNSDHNTVNIDQRSPFADVIRDLVPIAKEGSHMAKDTAAQLLN